RLMDADRSEASPARPRPPAASDQRPRSIPGGAAATVAPTPAPSNPLPPARRVRSGFMCLALVLSILAFVAVGADVLIDQWIGGRVSALFVFGTACLIAGACIALFAVIAAIGLVISSAFRRRVSMANLAAPRQTRQINPEKHHHC